MFTPEHSLLRRSIPLLSPDPARHPSGPPPDQARHPSGPPSHQARHPTGPTQPATPPRLPPHPACDPTHVAHSGGGGREGGRGREGGGGRVGPSLLQPSLSQQLAAPCRSRLRRASATLSLSSTMSFANLALAATPHHLVHGAACHRHARQLGQSSRQSQQPRAVSLDS